MENLNNELLQTISKLKIYDTNGNLLSYEDSSNIKEHIKHFSLIIKGKNIFANMHPEDFWALFEKHCKYEVIAETFEENIDKKNKVEALDFLAMIYFKEKTQTFEPIKILFDKLYKVYGIRGTILFDYDDKIKTDFKIIIVRNKN